jgi:hypothetical protein
MVLEGKAFAKRPQCGNHADYHGQPAPISKSDEGSINKSARHVGFGRTSKWALLPMKLMLDWGNFNTRLPRPEKGRLRGKLTEEELDKVLAWRRT